MGEDVETATPADARGMAASSWDNVSVKLGKEVWGALLAPTACALLGEICTPVAICRVLISDLRASLHCFKVGAWCLFVMCWRASVLSWREPCADAKGSLEADCQFALEQTSGISGVLWLLALSVNLLAQSERWRNSAISKAPLLRAALCPCGGWCGALGSRC